MNSCKISIQTLLFFEQSQLMKYSISIFFLYLTSIFILHHSSNAQFIGIGADFPISYSNSDSNPQGGFIQLTHTTPFLPNLNAGFFTIQKKFQSSKEGSHILKVSGTVSLLEFFYHIPIPLFSLGFGLGGGSLLTQTNILQDKTVLQKINASQQITAWFFQVGIPLWNTIELHGSYHNIQANDYQLVTKEEIELIGVKPTQNLSGSLIAAGFQIAF